MKYSKVIIMAIILLLSLQRLYSDISIDSSGLDEGLNETINRADEFLEEERAEAERLAKKNRLSGAIDYVQVEAECIRGLLPCIEKNLHISGGTGEFKPSFNGASSGTIYKGYQGKTSGTYTFTVTFDDKICSGNFHISGNKQHYSIKLGKDCHDNGSREW